MEQSQVSSFSCNDEDNGANRSDLRSGEAATELSIVVVNYNTAHLLDRMMGALDAAKGQLSIQTIIIDNASKDIPPSHLRAKYPQIEWITNATNVGFGRANNQALPLIRGNFVLLLNTDAFVSSDTLSKTLKFMEDHPSCGILGVKLTGEDGALQPSCRYFPTPWNEFVASAGLERLFRTTRLVDDMSWDHDSVRECDWVPGCYYLMRREVVEQIGLFDPRYFLYFEEVDHCRTARDAGWSIVFFPFTSVIHIGGESAKSQGPITGAGRQISTMQLESKFLFFRKHYGLRGVLTALLLSAVRVILVVTKDLVRQRKFRRSAEEFAELMTSLRILRSTKFGTIPTR